MSAFYNALAATAKRLINDKGAPVLLVRNTRRAIDPLTGDPVVYGQSEDKETRGILARYKSDMIDGSRILSTDRLLILDASVKPLPTDLPQIGGENIGAIVSILPSNPAGVPLVYFVQVRV